LKAEFATFISMWIIRSTGNRDFFVRNLVAVDSFGTVLDSEAHPMVLLFENDFFFASSEVDGRNRPGDKTVWQ